MLYRRCGRSGLKLPVISLGLWHNFGRVDPLKTARAMVHHAFDLGITHFDLANNYGPPPGAAEETLGKILRQDLKGFRHELIISTKAGYRMWEGPYGDGGSRKYLLTSLEQSLKRMHLDYVDIFYHHRPDDHTPLEETMSALDRIVRSGKALYVGISNYDGKRTEEAATLLRTLGSPCLVHQPKYSMFDRWIENGLLDVLNTAGIGCAVYSPLAQGLLTDRYLHGIPKDSRAAKPHGFLSREEVTEEKLKTIRALNEIARKRDQSLGQMAIAWVLRQNVVTTALIGASRIGQMHDNVAALKNLNFTDAELTAIDRVLGNP